MGEFTKKKRDDSIAEELSAMGQRAKGAVKEAAGTVTGNRSLEREGEIEKAEGRARQEANVATGARRWYGRSFDDRKSAERAYQSLRNRGYSDEDINLMMSDETRNRWFSDEDYDSGLSSKALEGAGAGGAIGGVAGAMLGAVLAIGTNIVVPGIGLVWGPLAGALMGSGAGALSGGLIGALVGWGIPEYEARQYERDIKNGRIVMGVTPRSDEDVQYFDREWRTY